MWFIKHHLPKIFSALWESKWKDYEQHVFDFSPFIGLFVLINLKTKKKNSYKNLAEQQLKLSKL
jgi:hypothetical protein